MKCGSTYVCETCYLFTLHAKLSVDMDLWKIDFVAPKESIVLMFGRNELDHRKNTSYYTELSGSKYLNSPQVFAF